MSLPSGTIAVNGERYDYTNNFPEMVGRGIESPEAGVSRYAVVAYAAALHVEVVLGEDYAGVVSLYFIQLSAEHREMTLTPSINGVPQDAFGFVAPNDDTEGGWIECDVSAQAGDTLGFHFTDGLPNNIASALAFGAPSSSASSVSVSLWDGLAEVPATVTALVSSGHTTTETDVTLSVAGLP